MFLYINDAFLKIKQRLIINQTSFLSFYVLPNSDSLYKILPFIPNNGSLGLWSCFCWCNCFSIKNFDVTFRRSNKIEVMEIVINSCMLLIFFVCLPFGN